MTASRSLGQVWWRNAYQIGHLPRSLASEVAPRLDEGNALRAYIYDAGNGCAWSVMAILIGPAVAASHALWIEQEAREGIRQMVRGRAIPHGLQSRISFENWNINRRSDRLRDAVETLSTIPFSIALPPVGSSMTVDEFADALTVDRAEGIDIIRRAGIRLVYRADYEVSGIDYRRFRVTARLRATAAGYVRQPRSCEFPLTYVPPGFDRPGASYRLSRGPEEYPF